jgi:hypothetical protein
VRSFKVIKTKLRSLLNQGALLTSQIRFGIALVSEASWKAKKLDEETDMKKRWLLFK